MGCGTSRSPLVGASVKSDPKVLASRYQLGRQLSEWPGVRVVAVVDETTGDQLAAMVWNGPSDGAAIGRFLATNRELRGFEHPNVAPVRDVVRDGADAVVIGELVRGLPLAEVAADGLPREDVVDIGRSIAAGLAALHARGITHGAVMPPVIVVDKGPSGWSPKLAGAGALPSLDSEWALCVEHLARSLDSNSDVPAVGAEDPASDVYSFGCLLYYLGTGEKPTVSSTGAPLFPRLDRVGSEQLAELVVETTASEPLIRPRLLEICSRLDDMSTTRLNPLGADSIVSAFGGDTGQHPKIEIDGGEANGDAAVPHLESETVGQQLGSSPSGAQLRSELSVPEPEPVVSAPLDDLLAEPSLAAAEADQPAIQAVVTTEVGVDTPGQPPFVDAEQPPLPRSRSQRDVGFPVGEAAAGAGVVAFIDRSRSNGDIVGGSLGQPADLDVAVPHDPGVPNSLGESWPADPDGSGPLDDLGLLDDGLPVNDVEPRYVVQSPLDPSDAGSTPLADPFGERSYVDEPVADHLIPGTDYADLQSEAELSQELPEPESEVVMASATGDIDSGFAGESGGSSWLLWVFGLLAICVAGLIAFSDVGSGLFSGDDGGQDVDQAADPAAPEAEGGDAASALVASLSAEPASLNLQPGQTSIIVSRGILAEGGPASALQLSDVSWASSNADVVTVDASGRVRATGPGEAVVTAALGEQVATVAVSVVGVISPPPAPASVTAELADGGIAVSWTPADSDAAVDTYEVRRFESSDIRQVDGSSLLWTEVADGESYAFEVRSINDQGAGAWSSPSQTVEASTETVEAGAPAAPATPRVTVDGTVVTVRWTPVDGADHYHLYEDDNGDGSSDDSHDASSGSHTLTDLGPGTYRFRTNACNDEGCSDLSAWSEPIVIEGGAESAAATVAVTVEGSKAFVVVSSSSCMVAQLTGGPSTLSSDGWPDASSGCALEHTFTMLDVPPGTYDLVTETVFQDGTSTKTPSTLVVEAAG